MLSGAQLKFSPQVPRDYEVFPIAKVRNSQVLKVFLTHLFHISLSLVLKFAGWNTKQQIL